MSSHFSLATIINFCSNDYPFLRHCIDSVKPFSSQIIIPVCDHFFDGRPENKEDLDLIYEENTDVQFIEFPFDRKNSLYGSHPSVYWHNLARMIGRYFVKEDLDFILFLDCDEIVDSARFINWLESFIDDGIDAIEFSNFWYFRQSRFQSKSWEHTPLLIRKKAVNGSMIMNENERAGIYDGVSGKKITAVNGLDSLPMFHHFSWVRTKEQLLRKVSSWSHNWQRNWTDLVEKEFSREFNGTDFVHGYEFVEVSPPYFIDLFKKPMGSPNIEISHVRHLSNEDVAKIDLSLTFDIPLCL